MRLSKYHYNPKTCRYEPTRISVVSMVGYALLFCMTTAVMATGILVLHSKFFTTEKSKALQAENYALKKHHAALQQEVAKVETVLAGLKQQDAGLYEKLFELPPEPENSMPVTDHEPTLLTNASGFKRTMKSLNAKTAALAARSSAHDAVFSETRVSNDQLDFFSSIPSIQPVAITEFTNLASGFGVRINPFHKGSYHHPGVDYSAPRGTPVVATGNGKVIDTMKGAKLPAGYGNYIEIDHDNGIVTFFAHLDDVLVKPGQRVSKGQVIGTVGMSGGTIAPHVHYEIIRDAERVNPVPYMMERMDSKMYAALQKAGNKKNQSLD